MPTSNEPEAVHRYIAWVSPSLFWCCSTLVEAMDYRSSHGALVYEPLGMTAAEKVAAEPVATPQEIIAKLIEADPHQWSSRPCQTCRAVTALLGRPFGCSAKAKGKCHACGN